jgi:hypothetical protein
MKSFFLIIGMVVFFLAPAFVSATEETTPDISGSWLNEAIEHIKKEEYKPSSQESDYEGERFSQPKYHFVNRKNNLRAYFDENAVELIPRVITNGKKWGFKIKSVLLEEKNNSNKIIDTPEFNIEENNIICESDDIKIVYSNSENGIEQNIIVAEKSDIEGINFAIETENLDFSQENDRFVLSSNGNEIIFQISSVRDAEDREIFYSLSADENKLSISINNEDVVYPIKISTNISSIISSAENSTVPLSAKAMGLSESPDWTAEGNQTEAYFGYSVSTAGDVNGDGYSDVIVGVPNYDLGLENDAGRAFVFHGSPSGLSTTHNWTAILPYSHKEDARFGYSVSGAGDVNGDGYSDVIVGAPYYDPIGIVDLENGAAFVYHGSPSGLSTSANWTTVFNTIYSNFGYSVSSAGDVNGDGYSDVIVGVRGYDNGQSDEGGAFVYHGSPSGLSGSAAWTAESNQEYAYFGTSVSSAGDVNGDGYSDVIVGANKYTNDQTAEGRAFVYHGSSSGLSASANWTAESDQVLSLFGISVSGAGDVNGDGYSDVIVGACEYDGRATDGGGIFVYHGSPSGLSASPDLSLDSDQTNASFGYSVSGAGDVDGDGYSDVILGAPDYDGGEENEGSVLVLYGSSSGILVSPSSYWYADSDQTGANFGISVSSAGDVNGDGYSDVIVGAYRYDNGQTDEGKAFVYHGSSPGLYTFRSWGHASNQDSAYFGSSVSSAGDVNGDGHSDVIVGAPGYDNGQTDEGAAFVYHGNQTCLSLDAAWSAEANQDSAYFGWSVSTAGDVNNDGYSDVIVGAPEYDNGETNEGAAFVYYGNSSGLSGSANWTAESDQAGAFFGASVSSAGDVNGDGYSDVIVGARYYDDGETDEGGAYVYHGSSSGLTTPSNWSAESNQGGALFGYSVSSAGDVNGDGYSDVIVGVRGYDNGQSDEGGAFVYHGSSSGLSAAANWSAESNQEEAFLGTSVSWAGDVNNDGYSDVIVGAPDYDAGETDEGMAFVYHGSPSGLSLNFNWTAQSNQSGTYFAASVSGAGDVNGDGYSDVIVGCHLYNNGEAGEGAAFVYHGSPSGLSNSADWTAESDKEWTFFGNSVSSAGDVDGNGYSDVIVGHYRFGYIETDEGTAAVYLGNGYDGIDLVPMQLNPQPPYLPIQLLGASGSDEVVLKLHGRTPAGRGKVKLQWEVKELGESFNGTGIGEGSYWYDVGVNGLDITEKVSGLNNQTAYHWRARLKYNPVTYNDAVHSRWLSIGPNGWNETDFITTSMSGIEEYTDSEGNIQLSVFPSISTNIFSIRFSVSEEEAEKDISLKVYNKAGIMVKNLFTGKKPAGTHTITWNGNKLPNDVYFIYLKKGKGENPIRKIVLLR